MIIANPFAQEHNLEQLPHLSRAHQFLHLVCQRQIVFCVRGRYLRQNFRYSAIDKKVGLRRIAQQLQARFNARTGNGAEIDMAGYILQTW